MVQRQFLEFKEESGIGDLLFVNISKPTKYRFYCRRDSWDDCYMVEFCSNSEDYHLYWGHNKQERRVIDATALLLPPYPEVEWKRIEFEPLLAYNLPKIIEEVERRISIYNMNIEKNNNRYSEL